VSAAAAIENGGCCAPGRCGRFHRQPPGRIQLPRHDPVGGSSGRSV